MERLFDIQVSLGFIIEDRRVGGNTGFQEARPARSANATASIVHDADKLQIDRLNIAGPLHPTPLTVKEIEKGLFTAEEKV
jgi:hypothetical protein